MVRPSSDAYYTFRLYDKIKKEYREDEIKLPSVTHIINTVLNKPYLLDWYYKQTLEGIEILLDHGANFSVDEIDSLLQEHKLRPVDIRNERAKEGSYVHNFFERLVSNKLDLDEINSVLNGNFSEKSSLATFTNGYLKGILNWWDQERNHWKKAQAEKVVTSLEYKFAGTADLVGTNGTILDLKTRAKKEFGSAVRISDLIQISAYARAVKTNSQYGYLLISYPDATWEQIKVDVEIHWKTFLLIRELYERIKNGE